MNWVDLCGDLHIAGRTEIWARFRPFPRVGSFSSPIGTHIKALCRAGIEVDYSIASAFQRSLIDAPADN